VPWQALRLPMEITTIIISYTVEENRKNIEKGKR
jgi:hypothetical protein